MDYKNFISIGKIVKPIGIKGNVKIISLTDFPERFNKLHKVSLYCERDKEFFINKFNGTYEFEIRECKIYETYVNVKFENFDCIEDTKSLVNKLLMIDEKLRIKLDKGSYYYYDLIDAGVYEKTKLIGKVISIVNYGSGDLFNVKYGDKEILIPFREEFVKKIDLDNKRIDVELIDGFLD